LKKQHKAQSSVEFVVLITFLLLLFTIIAIFVQARISEANQVKDKNYVDQLKNVIFNEVKIAEAMPYNYTKAFTLPQYIEGSFYNINIADGIELVINYKSKEYVYFLNNDFNTYSYTQPGINIISKKKYDNDIVYGFNAENFDADCTGYYDGEKCWITIEQSNCGAKCPDPWGNCIDFWEDEGCKILENRFKIKCDICNNSANAKYPGYKKTDEITTCYSGTGTAECNPPANQGFLRLCACNPT